MKKLGVVLIVLSCITWASLIGVPFLTVSTGMKVTISGALLVLGEVFFWGGTVLLGKEFLQTFLKKMKKGGVG